MAKSKSTMSKDRKQGRLALSTPAREASTPWTAFTPGPSAAVAAFVADHAGRYDPAADRYDVSAFDRDCSVDNAAQPKEIFDLHFYKGKKHWTAIREHLRHYLPKRLYPSGSGLVMDCFAGSGMTGVASMMEDRPCLLVDASPSASFISHCYTHPFPPQDLLDAYERMLSAPYPADLAKKLQAIAGEPIATLQEEIDWLFATRCDRCGGAATTDYVVHSERFQCSNCASVVALYDCPQEKVTYQVGGKKSQSTEVKTKNVCPHCLAKSGGKPHRDFVISTRGKKFGPVPVLVRYRCLDGCKPASAERLHNDDRRTKRGRFFEECDGAKLHLLETNDVPHWYPTDEFLRGYRYQRDALWLYGVDKVSDIYTRRNLWAIAAVVAAAKRTGAPQPLGLAVTGASLILSRMCRVSNTQVTNGTYYLPQVSKAIRPDRSIRKKKDTLATVYEHLDPALQGRVLVSNQDARGIELQEQSLDYIFIDPPYVDKVQYGELNFVWDCWLRFGTAWLGDEIIVNEFRGKTVSDWDRDLRVVFGRCLSALKPGRWMSVCFHDTDPSTWTMLQNAVLDVGFDLKGVGTIDPEQKSQNQYTAEKVAKADLVLHCRKPRAGEKSESENTDATLVSQRVRDIVIETLTAKGGQLREHLWDVVLKRLLTRGLMAEHRFDDILAEIAFRSESGRWFLREEFESLSGNDVKNEESAGTDLARFSRLRMLGVPASLAAEVVLKAPHLADGRPDEKQVVAYVGAKLGDEKGATKFELGGRLKGVEFYDALYFYLTRWLKGRAAGQTPRRNLADFLGEYLVRFKDGDKWLYRAPDDAEAGSLKKARQNGLGRRIRQFVAFLRNEGEFPREHVPDAKTLVAWLKHCAAFGLADEGVALFEKGGVIAQLGQLSEDDRFDCEDYYAQCRRRATKTRDDGSDESDEEDADTEEDNP